MFDQKQHVPYKMDYTDGRGQSAKNGVVSMTSASTRNESSQINKRRVASTSNKYTHTLPGTSDMEKRPFPHFGVSPAKEVHTASVQKM